MSGRSGGSKLQLLAGRILWFVGLWLAGVVTIAAVSWLLRLAVFG